MITFGHRKPEEGWACGRALVWEFARAYHLLHLKLTSLTDRTEAPSVPPELVGNHPPTWPTKQFQHHRRVASCILSSSNRSSGSFQTQTYTCLKLLVTPPNVTDVGCKEPLRILKGHEVRPRWVIDCGQAGDSDRDDVDYTR